MRNELSFVECSSEIRDRTRSARRSCLEGPCYVFLTSEAGLGFYERILNVCVCVCEFFFFFYVSELALDK